MELFPHGSFVRLRSRALESMYVYADEDGVHVTLRKLGAVPSLNAVWKAQLMPVDGGRGNDVLLLQGAAYGRYLAMAHEGEVPPEGHRGVRAVQRDYNLPHEDPPFMWTPYRLEAGQNYVRLHNEEIENQERCLRANLRHNGRELVTVQTRDGSLTTMMHWRVEAIPSTPVPLPLPPAPQPPICVWRHWFWWLTRHQNPGARRRRIWHFTLDDEGNPDNWPRFFSYDNSVSNLRTVVARRRNDENITLGVRAGYNARVIPLVTDLPNNQDPMQIIVYTTGSPAAAGLTYPQFDQPEAQRST